MAVSEQSNDPMAMMALSFIDLRAQYQAALRALDHAEECLLKCREPQDQAGLGGSVAALRSETAILSNINHSLRDVLDQILRDVERLARAG